jgi:hypothetical protein
MHTFQSSTQTCTVLSGLKCNKWGEIHNCHLRLQLPSITSPWSIVLYMLSHNFAKHVHYQHFSPSRNYYYSYLLETRSVRLRLACMMMKLGLQYLSVRFNISSILAGKFAEIQWGIIYFIPSSFTFFLPFIHLSPSLLLSPWIKLRLIL